jgi:hypothetical protein
MKTNSKKLGNQGEREIAKQLSEWIFNDSHVLKRAPDSGAQKDIYTGDIIPIKMIDWGYFPLHIEIKAGYTDLTPTLLNFKMVSKWYLKCVEESTIPGNKQEIILLIMNFKSRQGVLLATNKELNIPWKCILNIDPHIVYCYDYKEMLSCYTFCEVFA